MNPERESKLLCPIGLQARLCVIERALISWRMSGFGKPVSTPSKSRACFSGTCAESEIALAKAKTRTAAKAKGVKAPARKTAVKAAAAKPVVRKAAVAKAAAPKTAAPKKDVSKKIVAVKPAKVSPPAKTAAVTKVEKVPQAEAPSAPIVKPASAPSKVLSAPKLVGVAKSAPQPHRAPQPAAAPQFRADIPPAEGFSLMVDGHFKNQFATLKSAKDAASELRARFPVLRVEIYDAEKKARLKV